MAASSKSAVVTVETLQRNMVKRIDNKTFKEYVGVLNTQLKLLKENFLLLNSILGKDLSIPNSVQLPPDLKRCDIELQENDIAKYDYESELQIDLAQYGIKLEKDDFNSLTAVLFGYIVNLEELNSELKSCNPNKKKLLRQQIDDIENKKLIVELKICENRLAFYNDALAEAISPAEINKKNEEKHHFEFKKCILEIKVCNILLKKYALDLKNLCAMRDSGEYTQYSDLSEKIANIESNLKMVENRKRAYRLNQCAYALEQCSLELNYFHNMLLRERPHVLNGLCENIAFKKLIECAHQILAEFFLTPQIFNPKVLELLQPLVNILYCFNKTHEPIAIENTLKKFEKVKLVVAKTGDLCEREWITFCDDNIVLSANDTDVKRSCFNTRVECVLRGMMIKEIINELSENKARKGEIFNQAHKIQVEENIEKLAGIGVMSEKYFKEILKVLKENKVLNESEIKDLERNLENLFKVGSRESLSKDAKAIILNRLNKKYLGPLKETYFVTFLVFKLIKLETQRAENGTPLLQDERAITKVENCISYLMEQYLLPNKVLSCYSDHANPANSAVEENASEITTEIISKVNRNKPISIPGGDIPKTYIETLQKCKDENGIVNVEQLFFALFADYNKGGLFLLAHPLRHHGDRVDKICACVKKAIEEDEEMVDWQGVLTALEQWPDDKSLAEQGSLKKRIHFFRRVIEQIDDIKEEPIPHASCKL